MTESFLGESLAVLTRTPATLSALLGDLPDAWTTATEGPGTWSPYVIIGHLIHGERVDWMPRLAIILEHGTDRPFDKFDRETQFAESANPSLATLLDKFAELRRENLARLHSLNFRKITRSRHKRRVDHPEHRTSQQSEETTPGLAESESTCLA